MNDPQIRNAFHTTFLQEHHKNPAVLVVDELGLKHGVCRADIAVISHTFIGYEIKSDVDTLRRLDSQLISYNAVFDKLFLVVTSKYLREAKTMIPEWWGIILAEETTHKIHFQYVRDAAVNAETNNYSIAQLLWRDEAIDILTKLGVKGKDLRKSRALLYYDILDLLSPSQLRNTVREYLKKRQGWRDHAILPAYDGLYQPRDTELGFQV